MGSSSLPAFYYLTFNFFKASHYVNVTKIRTHTSNRDEEFHWQLVSRSPPEWVAVLFSVFLLGTNISYFLWQLFNEYLKILIMAHHPPQSFSSGLRFPQLFPVPWVPDWGPFRWWVSLEWREHQDKTLWCWGHRDDWDQTAFLFNTHTTLLDGYKLAVK